MAGERGKVTTDYDWIKTFVPLPSFLREALIRPQYSYLSQSQSAVVCGVLRVWSVTGNIHFDAIITVKG